jgi:RNA polymerase sigma factor (TIGR02999 family)
MSAQNVTQLLRQWRDGDSHALEHLLPIVDSEFRRLAAHHLRSERLGHTLQATAVVNEAYLCLIKHPPDIHWQSRAQFKAIVSHMMHQILVNHARARNAMKRGGGEHRLSLDAALELATPEPEVDLLALEDALEHLHTVAPDACQIVKLRYFGGLTIEEAAEVMHVSPSSIKRKWNFARAWLKEALSDEIV